MKQRYKKHGLRGTRYQETFNRLFEQQGGKCAICERHAEQIRSRLRLKLVIDHCHETGRIRGLLCEECNAALGYLENYGSATSAQEAGWPEPQWPYFPRIQEHIACFRAEHGERIHRYIASTD